MTDARSEARNLAQQRRRALRRDELNAAERERRATDPLYAERKRERSRVAVDTWKKRHPDRAKEIAKRHYDKYAKEYQAEARERYWKNRDARKAYSKGRYCADRGRWLADQKERAFNRKLACLDAYGGRICSCCGETTVAFLTLDHINGCGLAQRKIEGSGSTNYRRLIKQGFPAGFRVLCFNCNCGRRVNGGECPHQAANT